MKWLFIILLLAGMAQAEQVKMIHNSQTGRGDYITVLSSSTLPSGSTQYIQNTLTPTTNTQKFSVQVGSFSVAGWYIMDADDCVWQTTINTSGTLQTALVNCPTAAGFLLMEDGTFILMEDTTFILAE